MMDMLDQVPEESKNDSSTCVKIFTEVMGKENPGRVCGYGLGVTPTMLWGNSGMKMQTISS